MIRKTTDSPVTDSPIAKKTVAETTSAPKSAAAVKSKPTQSASTTAVTQTASAQKQSSDTAKKSTPTKKSPTTKKSAATEKRPARKASATTDKAAKSSAKTTKTQAKVQKFRIRLTCFDHVLIDESTSNIVNTVKRTGANVCGPVPLPVRRHRYDLLRSPHKDKRSREQIEIREHCRLLDIIDISNKATSALTNLDLPPGVHADIKVMKV